MLCSDRRLADHFGGKLHLGYMQIREKLAEMQVNIFALFPRALNYVGFLVIPVYCSSIFTKF